MNLLQAKAVLDIARQNLEYYNKTIEVSRSRYAAGDMAKVDLVRIELQLAQYQSDVVNAQVNVRTAKIALLTLLNDRTPVDRFDVTGVYDFKDALMAAGGIPSGGDGDAARSKGRGTRR